MKIIETKSGNQYSLTKKERGILSANCRYMRGNRNFIQFSKDLGYKGPHGASLLSHLERGKSVGKMLDLLAEHAYITDMVPSATTVDSCKYVLCQELLSGNTFEPVCQHVRKPYRKGKAKRKNKTKQDWKHLTQEILYAPPKQTSCITVVGNAEFTLDGVTVTVRGSKAVTVQVG